MLVIIVTLMIIGTMLCACEEKERYNEDEIISFISEYLDSRYGEVTKDTIEESVQKQNQYYSDRMLNTPAWVNYPDNIDSSIDYFNEYQYYSHILRSIIKKEENYYMADFSVLYISEKDHYYDNYVDYILSFTISMDENGLKIDNVNPIKNETTYIMGGELHVSVEKVILMFPEESEGAEE